MSANEGKRCEPVNCYGCVRCQQTHFEDTDAALYREHLMWQSKHGTSLFHETIDERRKRYGLEQAHGERE